jgi:hypothetical protein
MKLFAGLLEGAIGDAGRSLVGMETGRNLMIYAAFVKQRQHGYRAVNGIQGLTGFSMCVGMEQRLSGEAPQQRA